MIYPRLSMTLTAGKCFKKYPRFFSVINQKRFCHRHTESPPEDLNIDAKLISSVRSVHGLAYDHHLPRFITICKEIQRVYLPEENDLITAITNQPILSSFNAKEWRETVKFLNDNGFDIKAILSILSKCPYILGIKTNDRLKIFSTLRRFGLSGKLLKRIVSGAPRLLTLDAKFTETQFKSLMFLFPFADVKKLIWMCPNVLFDDIEETKAKLMYLIHEVRIKHEDIVSSTALSMTLIHIKKRFAFCMRTGYYKLAHPKRQVNNPGIDEIMDIPLRNLVEAKIGVRWEEFIVFEKMFEKESEVSDDETEDESEDEDDESEDEDDESENEDVESKNESNIKRKKK